MAKVWKYTPWVTRLMLVPPTLIFTMVAMRHVLHPVESAAAEGIVFSSPLGATIARVGLGGFPLSCALFMLFCLASRRRVAIGLVFVATLVGVVLGVRVFGMLMDGTVQESMRLVRVEAIMLVLFAIGLWVDTASRQREMKAA